MWILLLLLCSSLVSGQSPPVQVSLRSSWPAPPPLVEILETVSNENPDAFFPFIDSLIHSETPVALDKLTPEAAHQYALEIATAKGFISGPDVLSAVEMNLALHSATPKIEAFYHHYLNHASRRNSLDCDAWVDWYGTVICDAETLVHLVGTESIDSSNKTSDGTFGRPKLLAFDHIYPPPSRTLESPPRTAILYASLTSPKFRELHNFLFSAAQKPSTHVEYVFRHIPPKTVDTCARNYLSGYNIVLDLKKMDYLALDDRHTKQRGSASTDDVVDDSGAEEDPIIALIEAYAENTTAPDANVPLTEDELGLIGFQATQLIADSIGDPLATLKRLSQNFPKYATSLSRRVVVNESIEEEILGNQLRVQGGMNAFWFNGASLAEKDLNPFGLLRIMRKERGIMKSLTSLGLDRTEAIDLLNHPAIASAQSVSPVLDGIFDASDRPEEGGVIVWWNNIEKDSRYSQWSASIHMLLRPLFPGQFHSVKLNLINVIMVLDLSQMSNLNIIAGPVANIIDRGFPFRFGLVPQIETPEAAQMARLFYYLVHNHGRKKTMEYLKKISQFDVPPQFQTSALDWTAVGREFADLFLGEEQDKDMPNLEDILRGEHSPPVDFGNVQAYAERLSATSSSGGHVFINGKHYAMDDLFLRNMQVESSSQMQYLQEQIYGGKLTDEQAAPSVMENYFYDLPTSYQRRNRHIIPTSTPSSLRIFNIPDVFSQVGVSSSPALFVYPESDLLSIPLTIYIVVDLDTEEGKELIKEALKAMDEESKFRVSVIHNPATADRQAEVSTSRLFAHLISSNSLSKISPTRLIRALGPGGSPENSQAQVPLDQESLDDLAGGLKLADMDLAVYEKFVNSGKLLLRELGVSPGQQVLLVNGRVVGPIKRGEFVAADFKALGIYELRRRVQPVVEALEDLSRNASSSDRASYAQLVSAASSVVSAIQLPDPSESGLFDTPPRPRQRGYRFLDDNYTSFQFGKHESCQYEIALLVDPLSETAQKWSSLVEWLAHVPDTFIQIYLNPAHASEIPLKRFFRSNLLPSLAFDNAGMEIPAQTIFEGLPIDPIYTLAVDVPPSWLVRPRESLYDLDNIQLGHLAEEDRSLEAVFDLDYLVIEGHARDTQTNVPPRGLQLELLNGDRTPIDDTQVVANLGYFQFKAKPGVFELEIREGRGRDIFALQSVGNEGWDSPTVEAVGKEITLTSFEGLTLYPRFVRLPGMEDADVLSDARYRKEDTGLFGDITSRFKSLFGAKENTTAVAPAQAEINIFTVASGLLYERFVAIMILSVLRNTKSTVKFWFIENFLSPSFLEFIPHLAEAYNFQYELVTYKWPSWLRAQKEKQRIIWGYKILFLDVLFPMDLKKVIFVDADQIVRADLKELVDLDLHGAPYGYTPMGDDNYEMEGFRFWKTGYWKDFLKGRPYHISALYVVDLVRFRQLAAGDMLRGHYQQLSADPQSLANLDQDLPNNLQRDVPIFSLHEDWLWCETWCSKDRLHRAKTIDLCQNPLTKEPKLHRARQIPEWEEYDNEISRFAQELAKKGLIRSRVATADQLADAGSGSGSAPSKSAEQTETSGEAKEEKIRDEL